MHRNARSAAAVVALLAVMAACSGPVTEITEFPDVPQRIVIVTTTGDVIIDADAAVDGVRIESALQGTDITSTLEDGVLTLGDDCDGDGCSVNYIVQMRGDVALEVTTESGSIAVSEINGDVLLQSQTGPITLSAVSGSAVATTEEAAIIATRMESALAEFRAGEGDIDVTFDEPVEALVVETGRGDVTAQLPDGAYAITTDTADGAVDLTFESDPASDKTVSLTTGEGDITVYRR